MDGTEFAWRDTVKEESRNRSWSKAVGCSQYLAIGLGHHSAWWTAIVGFQELASSVLCFTMVVDSTVKQKENGGDGRINLVRGNGRDMGLGNISES